MAQTPLAPSLNQNAPASGNPLRVSIKETWYKQLKSYLNLLRYREEIRRLEVPVSPLQLEKKFAEILKIIRPNAEYPKNASYINQNFDERERRVIYAMLEEIKEKLPWPGIQWVEIYEKIRLMNLQQ